MKSLATKSTSNCISKKFYVKGMHCNACNLLIEKNIKNNFDVNCVEASYQRNFVEIEADKKNLPSLSQLNNIFKQHGYSFFENENRDALSKQDLILSLVIFISFIIIFLLFQKLGIKTNFDLNSGSILTNYFIFGLIAGISSCAALVGSMLLSLSKSWIQSGSNQNKFIPFIMFNSSRIIFFIIFGFLLGYLGSFFKISIIFSSLVTILISLLIFMIGINMIGINIGFSTKNIFFKKVFGFALDEKSYIHKYSPIIMGAITFFVPCGFTMIAQSNALVTGDGVKGALILGSFALGTLPALALISFTSVKLFSNPNFSKKFSIVVGSLIIFFSIYTLNSQLNVLGLPNINKISNKLPVKKVEKTYNISTDIQYMQMEANDFDYSPKNFWLKKGVKTIWEIYDNGAAGCAKAVYANGLYPDVIYLKPGLNKVEFTPQTAGTFKISCSMGMVSPVIVVVE